MASAKENITGSDCKLNAVWQDPGLILLHNRNNLIPIIGKVSRASDHCPSAALPQLG
jgi:hypothetical protein